NSAIPANPHNRECSPQLTTVGVCMIDLHEHHIGLREAGTIIGRDGRPVHVSTILRWILSGVRGPDGGKVRLDGARIGGRWTTSREALERFLAALNPDTCEPAPRTTAARRRASDAVDRELNRIGI